jgi:hypothetical protein
VSAISYSGTVQFGLCADPTVVDRLPSLAGAIGEELEDLAARGLRATSS